MREIYNAKRSGSMTDRRSTTTQPRVSDVRSGSMTDVTGEAGRSQQPQPSGQTRYRIVSREGRLQVVEAK